MRRSKTVYSFNEFGKYSGTDVAYESWDTVNFENPIFLIPSNSTEIQPPIFDENTEYVFFNKIDETWNVEEIPNELNTPKPDFDINTQKIVWVDGEWVVLEIPTPENTFKPEFDESVYTCEWVSGEWVLDLIPTWDSIRNERDLLLSQSDWSVMPDSSPKPSKESWLNYRQGLRDIPQNFSNPEDVVFPTKP